VAAVIHRPGEVALFRRGPAMSGAGHWEFPGGKVEVGESEPQALRREIREELAVNINVGEFVGETIHQYPSKKIHLRFYWVSPPLESFVLSEHDGHQWVNPHLLDVRILSEGDRAIVDVICRDERFKIY
jgi:mutator protein MutT